MKKISFLATLIVGLLFSTLSYGANDIQPTDLNSAQLTTVDISNFSAQEIEAAELPLQNLEMEFDGEPECCLTCTATVSVIIFEFSISWCCWRCEEPKR